MKTFEKIIGKERTERIKENLLNMTSEEFEKIIKSTGFNPYGSYKKEEKKKIQNLFNDFPNVVDLCGISTDNWGDRILSIRVWNLPGEVKNDEDLMYYTFTYSI